MGAAQAVAQGAAPRTRGAGAGAGAGAAAPGPTQAGDPAGIGIAHRNAALRASAMGRVPAARRASPFAARLGPDSLTARPSARRSTSTEPSWSVRIDPRAARAEPVERRSRRVAVRVAGAGRGDRDSRVDGVDERLGRRRGAAVVGDLDQVDAREPAGEQRGVDALLDVAHQQEPAAVRLAQEHDRDVVDPRAGVGRLERHGARVRPQDRQPDLAEADLRAGREEATGRSVVEDRVPGRPSGAGPVHAGLVHPSDVVALEDPRQACDVILVRVRQHHDVEPPVPRRDARVQRQQDPIGVGATVDQHPGAGPRLEQDRVALPDVQDGEARLPLDRVAERQAHDGDGQRRRGEPDAVASSEERRLRCRCRRPGWLARRLRACRAAAPEPADGGRAAEDRDAGRRRGGLRAARRQGDRGERDGGGEPDDGHDDVEHDPARQARDRGDERRRAEQAARLRRASPRRRRAWPPGRGGPRRG